jgi:molybdopterin-guanine dinucleotide biosynthesis adapter protein
VAGVNVPHEMLGVILHDQRRQAEDLLSRFAAALVARGVDVGGLVQRTTKEPNGKNRMELIDIRTGAVYRISQNLGPGSDACCLNPGGLSEASLVIRREIDHRPELLVINKFAGEEAEGHGLAPDMFEAIAQGMPVLTTLSRRREPRWQLLTGGAGTMLPPREEALWAWWEKVRGRSRRSASGMKVFGLAGWSGTGKTTLVEKLIVGMTQRGLRVSTIKHAHHSVDLDKPGKDTYRHRQAGATEVMLATGQRWALMHERRDEAEPSVEELIAHMTPVDLLLIEGFKAHAHPKLEVYRPSLGKPMLWPNDPDIVAVASDEPVVDLPLPVLDLNNGEAILQFILEKVGLAG